MEIKLTVGVSNRHVHLSEKDKQFLFGNIEVKVEKELNQPGQFASNLKVTLKTKKDIIEDVRVVGPIRDYTQVEISKTDSFKLGINPPVRDSGDVMGSSPIILVGPEGELYLKEGCIIAARHVHITQNEIEKYHLEHLQKVKIVTSGPKNGILGDVHLKSTGKDYFELHLDTDDANAHLLKNGDEVTMVIDEN